MSEWWVVVGPNAGRDDDLAARTTAALAGLDLQHETWVSSSGPAVAGLVGEGVEKGFSNFVAVGGDRTANLVLNGLIAHEWPSPPTLAILPAGSGSDFIRTFALPQRLEDAAAHLVDEERYPTDIGRIVGSFGIRYFLNASNAGVAARSAAVASRMPARLGSARCTIAFWMALSRFPPAKVPIEVDGRELGGDLMNVVIANGQFVGGGLNVAPRATVEDGVFDVQLFSGPRSVALAVMPRVLRGTHLSHRSVRRTKGSSIKVDCPDSWPIEADGEPIGTGPITVEIVPHAIFFKI